MNWNETFSLEIDLEMSIDKEGKEQRRKTVESIENTRREGGDGVGVN